MSADMQIACVSAFLGGGFALLVAFASALFRDWLDERSRKRAREEIKVATQEDVERYGAYSYEESEIAEAGIGRLRAATAMKERGAELQRLGAELAGLKAELTELVELDLTELVALDLTELVELDLTELVDEARKVQPPESEIADEERSE